MKISLTMKNNLIHFFPILVIVAIVALVAATNSRYETSVQMTGEAEFPTTVLEISPYDTVTNYHNIGPGEEIKLKYLIKNNADDKINNNNLQYYLKLVNTDGTDVQNVQVKIRESVEDNKTYDQITSLNYINGKGFGAVQLRKDGISETKTFDVFLKINSNMPSGQADYKLKAYVESATNTDLNMTKTADLKLNVLGIFTYSTTASAATITGVTEYGVSKINNYTTLNIPQTYNGLPVTTINEITNLKNKTNITELIIPKTVTSIANNAFAGYSNLETLTCPITLNMANVFSNVTTGLNTVTFTTGDSSTAGFDYTDSTYQLTPWYYSRGTAGTAQANPITINFDEDITYIGNYTFKNLYRLTDDVEELLVFDDTLTKIGTNAFSGTNLTGNVYVTSFGGVVAELGADAFDNTIQKYIRGNEITFGGEQFLIFDYADHKLSLVSKYCLSKTANTQVTKNETVSDYGRRFSNSSYWGSVINNIEFDLQTPEMLELLRNTSGETAENNAIIKAQEYGAAKAALTGKTITARLMTKKEAETVGGLPGSNSEIIRLKDMISGRYSNGEAPADDYLRYWLGTAVVSEVVWHLSGEYNNVYYDKYTNEDYGVRPILVVTNP